MQDQLEVAPVYDLGHYLRPLKRHRRLLIAAVIGGFVIGLAFALISKPSYSAGARVLVDPPPASTQTTVTATGSRTPNALVNMDTEAQNVKSLPVAVLAQQFLKTSTSPNKLLGRVSATVPANTTVLRIACKARSATAAQTCANAFASAYLKNRASGETADLNRQLTAANGLLASFNAKLQKDLAAGVAAQKGTVAKNLAFGRVANDNQQIGLLTSQQNTLNGELHGLPGDAGSVQSAAGLGVASKTSRGIPPLTGLIIGLLVGVAAIFGRERFDRFVRHRDDLLRFGVELIAEIDPASPRQGVAQRARENAARTRFDQRVASIVAGSFDEAGGVIYVAAVSPGQTDADMADHLASTLASVGHHVEVVRPLAVQTVTPSATHAVPHPVNDAPVAIESTSSMLGWPSAETDSQPATELSTEPSTELVTTEPQAVLTPVETPPDSVPLSIRMQLELARQRAQFVILAGDPAASDAQAYVLAGLSDATLLVVDPQATTRTDLADVVDQLSVTGTELLGAVIWRPQPAAQRPTPPSVDRDRTSSRPRQPTVTNVQTRPGEPNRADRSTTLGTDKLGSGPTRPYRPVDAAR